MLSEETKQSILALQKRYPQPRSALIPALHLAQAEIGFLPLEAQAEVAALFNLALNEVHSVVSFYDMFFEEPVGKHVVHICKNLSCMLRGSDALMQAVCQKLSVQPRERSADGEFTVIPSECLAACDRAPMMLIDSHVIGPVALEDLDAILEAAKQTEGHAAPIEKGSITHA